MSNALFLFPSGDKSFQLLLMEGECSCVGLLSYVIPVSKKTMKDCPGPSWLGYWPCPSSNNHSKSHCKGATKYKHFVYHRLADKRCTYMVMGSWYIGYNQFNFQTLTFYKHFNKVNMYRLKHFEIFLCFHQPHFLLSWSINILLLTGILSLSQM